MQNARIANFVCKTIAGESPTEVEGVAVPRIGTKLTLPLKKKTFSSGK